MTAESERERKENVIIVKGHRHLLPLKMLMLLMLLYTPIALKKVLQL